MSFTLALLFTVSLVWAETPLETFEATNIEYSKTYFEFLRMEKDGDFYIENQKSIVQRANLDYTAKNDSFVQLKQQLDAIDDKIANIPLRLKTIDSLLRDLSDILDQVKEDAVRQGLFNNAKSITRPNIARKIAIHEANRRKLIQKIEKLESEIEAILKGTGYSTLKKQTQSAKAEILKIQNARPQLLNIVEDLKAELSQFEISQTELNSEIILMSAKMDDLIEKDIPVAQSRLARTQKKHDEDEAIADRIFAEVTSLKNKIEILEADQADREQQRDRETRRIRRLRQELSEIRSETSVLPELNSRQSDLSNSIIPSWQRQVRRLQSDESSASSHLSSADSNLRQARQNLRSKKQDYDQASAKVQRIQGRIQNLNGKKSRLEQSVSRKSQLQRRKGNLSQKIRQRSQQIQNLSGKISNVQSNVSSFQNRVDNLSSKLSQVQSRASNLQSRLSNLQGRLSQAQSELAAAEQSGDAAAIAKAQNKIQNINSKISEVNGKLSQVNSNVTNIQSKLSSAQSKLHQANSRLQNLQSKLSSAQSEKSDFEQKLSNVESKLSTIAQHESQLADTNNKLSNAQSRLSGAERDLSNADSSLKSARQQRKNRRREFDDAQSTLSQIQQELSSSQNTLREFESELASVSDEIDRLERLDSEGDDIENNRLPAARRRKARAIRELNSILAELEIRRSELSDAEDRYSVAFGHLDKSKDGLRQASRFLQFIRNRKSELSTEIENAKAAKKTLDSDILKTKENKKKHQTQLSKHENRLETLNKLVFNNEAKMRKIHNLEVEKLNSKISNVSGELSIAERKSAQYQDLSESLKVTRKKRLSLAKDRLKIVERSGYLEKEKFKITPAVNAAEAKKQTSQAALQKQKTKLEQLESQVSTLPDTMEALEKDNFDQLRSILSN